MGLRCPILVEKEWRYGDHDYEDKEMFVRDKRDEICGR